MGKTCKMPLLSSIKNFANDNAFKKYIIQMKSVDCRVVEL